MRRTHTHRENEYVCKCRHMLAKVCCGSEVDFNYQSLPPTYFQMGISLSLAAAYSNLGDHSLAHRLQKFSPFYFTAPAKCEDSLLQFK